MLPLQQVIFLFSYLNFHFIFAEEENRLLKNEVQNLVQLL